MNWMDRLERKIGKFAIPHITRILLIINLVGYILYLLAQVNPVVESLTGYLAFSAEGILFHGQVFRLFTWILVPSVGGFSIWEILFLICLLLMGENMERSLGTFKMNIYFLGGILLNDIGGIVIHLLVRGIFRIPVNMHFPFEIHLSMYYMLFSLYLMLGLFMPEATVRLYFVLPIKMKWLMILYIVGLLFEIYTYCRMGLAYGLVYCPEIVFALINLGLFVYFCKNRISRRHRKKQKQFQRQMHFAQPRPGSGIAKHKCAICGRTELSDPDMAFRYCSKCDGAYEYCEEHLYSHTHVKR